ncbi:uncharacterized protein SPSK_09609 [Sporothrix schenckii 1099-18]|uniref:Uncharacterized protein n=1 Tax=Sporothrix schenckii 1099-18 TaxID=1397361 RepID=A0A0F2MBU0_SPOSC|nr:uncharacterized protein SPSK_09609 [Sporothrix schenckii 1099-18]KJR85626.1 hypothetical protein SPSK_09609 [Sporothrix schenckii 1099-18]
MTDATTTPFKDNKPYALTSPEQEQWKVGVPGIARLKYAFQTSKDEKKISQASIESAVKLKDFHLVDRYEPILRDWSTLFDNIIPFLAVDDRVVGSVVHSPALQLWKTGDHPWSRDWAFVRLDRTKFPDNGNGLKNTVDLRVRSLPASLNKFPFPTDRLLTLSDKRKDIVTLQEMRDRKSLDGNGSRSFIVAKNGASTGLIFGSPSELMSTVRYCMPGGHSYTTHEWSIEGSLDNLLEPFSRGGDSGSLVFTIEGRLAGIVTGGAAVGENSGVDITYVTPLEVILKDIEDCLGNRKVRLL